MELSLARESLRFRRAVPTAYGELAVRELVRVTLTDADGVEGRGEAAPLEPYDGVPLERVVAALRGYRRALVRPAPGVGALEACRAVDPLPQALAAIDLALWDLAGRRAGRPVCELLSERPAGAVEVNASIAALAPAAAAREAAAAVAAGYRTIKLKVGVPGDLERVAAVREAIGPGPRLRLDANGAWSVEEAARALGEIARHRIELVEEPVHGLEAVRRLRARAGVPIAIDETATAPGAPEAGAADAVCLKVARAGGITGLLDVAARARGAGATIYLSSTYDGPLGIAAALHAAAALAPLPACGLATLELFEDPGVALPVRDGAITVPRAPGLLP